MAKSFQIAKFNEFLGLWIAQKTKTYTSDIWKKGLNSTNLMSFWAFVHSLTFVSSVKIYKF